MSFAVFDAKRKLMGELDNDSPVIDDIVNNSEDYMREVRDLDVIRNEDGLVSLIAVECKLSAGKDIVDKYESLADAKMERGVDSFQSETIDAIYSSNLLRVREAKPLIQNLEGVVDLVVSSIVSGLIKEFLEAVMEDDKEQLFTVAHRYSQLFANISPRYGNLANKRLERYAAFASDVEALDEKLGSLKGIKGFPEKEALISIGRSLQKLEKEYRKTEKKHKPRFKDKKLYNCEQNIQRLANLRIDLDYVISNYDCLGRSQVDNVNRAFLSHNNSYWDSGYPVSDDVVYHARDGRMWDVRDFIQADNTILRDIVQQEALQGNNFNETAYKCMIWVQTNITYRSDPQLTNHPKEWQFPTETVQLGTGDCEDGTNLMISLMRNAGVPADKVRNACGEVDGGGHSWSLYQREHDDEWVILDWCYKATEVPIKERELARDREDYRTVWFAFNDEHSWSHESIIVNKNCSPRGQVTPSLLRQRIVRYKEILDLASQISNEPIRQLVEEARDLEAEIKKFGVDQIRIDRIRSLEREKNQMEGKYRAYRDDRFLGEAVADYDGLIRNLDGSIQALISSSISSVDATYRQIEANPTEELVDNLVKLYESLGHSEGVNRVKALNNGVQLIDKPIQRIDQGIEYIKRRLDGMDTAQTSDYDYLTGLESPRTYNFLLLKRELEQQPNDDSWVNGVSRVGKRVVSIDKVYNAADLRFMKSLEAGLQIQLELCAQEMTLPRREKVNEVLGNVHNLISKSECIPTENISILTY